MGQNDLIGFVSIGAGAGILASTFAPSNVLAGLPLVGGVPPHMLLPIGLGAIGLGAALSVSDVPASGAGGGAQKAKK